MIRPSRFLAWFPPPAFLLPPAVGLDISDRSIKFCQLVLSGGRLSLQKFGERVLGAEVVEGGNIKNQALLTKTLKEVAAEHDFCYVFASLPEERAYIVEVKLPPMVPRHIRGSLELQLEDHVPLPSSEVFFDYEMPPPATGDPADSRAVVTAMPREVVLSYEAAITAAGLVPLSFEVEAQAIKRAVVQPGNLSTTLLVDFGKTRTSFFVVAADTVIYTSTADHIGGEILTQAIVKDLTVPYTEAEKLKIEFGLLYSQNKKTELIFALLPAVSVLRDEILIRYQYWQSQSGIAGSQRRINKIILSGGQVTLPGLVEYLNAELPVPVELGNVWSQIKDRGSTVPPINFNQSFRYATALGLALRPWTAIASL